MFMGGLKMADGGTTSALVFDHSTYTYIWTNHQCTFVTQSQEGAKMGPLNEVVRT